MRFVFHDAQRWNWTPHANFRIHRAPAPVTGTATAIPPRDAQRFQLKTEQETVLGTKGPQHCLRARMTKSRHMVALGAACAANILTMKDATAFLDDRRLSFSSSCIHNNIHNFQVAKICFQVWTPLPQHALYSLLHSLRPLVSVISAQLLSTENEQF